MVWWKRSSARRWTVAHRQLAKMLQKFGPLAINHPRKRCHMLPHPDLQKCCKTWLANGPLAIDDSKKPCETQRVPCKHAAKGSLSMRRWPSTTANKTLRNSGYDLQTCCKTKLSLVDGWLAIDKRRRTLAKLSL